MSMKLKGIIVVLVLIEAVLLGFMFLGGVKFQLLFPHGEIARQERNLIIIATLIMLVIIVPVYSSIFFIARKYREDNKTIDRTNKINSNPRIELLWWLGPIIIISTIAAITWKATHVLDPVNVIASNEKPVNIQVIALQWKWLFIYPEEGIATVNFIQFPKGVPVNFELTSDAPMNSFWIPSLSGQIYAMTGMSNRIHMIADHEGDFPGMAAEINGIGYSGMKFIARASTHDKYDLWIQDVKREGSILSKDVYNTLAIPTTNEKIMYYYPVENNLYNKIIMKYMHPTGIEKSNNE